MLRKEERTVHQKRRQKTKRKREEKTKRIDAAFEKTLADKTSALHFESARLRACGGDFTLGGGHAPV